MFLSHILLRSTALRTEYFLRLIEIDIDEPPKQMQPLIECMIEHKIMETVSNIFRGHEISLFSFVLLASCLWNEFGEKEGGSEDSMFEL